ncbi:hypothetical protein CR205_03940 [Alteribacter lacisalsi]|jgi:hypothetical protein|uniref:Uncharacterized protein n=1 Tax=Alteribacter lacisalsi TaxID=2045244 RepID=A0A2W0H7A7_9BACI|nr:hypothetical protein [Alteribacter lacisalsi]PYZ97753.1 hypothetical protein CR205_03940 [Alteribacter lacisalsi]
MAEFHPLCIRAEKLYDWVTRQVDKELTFSGPAGLAELDFDCDGEEGADDPCDLLPPGEDFIVTVVEVEDTVECSEVGTRRNVFVPELGIELQEVKIRKQGSFVVELRLDEDDVDPICTSGEIDFCLFEKFLLCAPEGTEVDCDVFDFSGSGVVCCINGEFSSLQLTLHICQSVQVHADVILEIEGAECRPREDIILPISRLCPEIAFPPQCPEIFPAHNGHHKEK